MPVPQIFVVGSSMISSSGWMSFAMGWKAFLDSCICCDDAVSDVEFGRGMGSCGISGRSCFVAVSR